MASIEYEYNWKKAKEAVQNGHVDILKLMLESYQTSVLQKQTEEEEEKNQSNQRVDNDNDNGSDNGSDSGSDSDSDSGSDSGSDSDCRPSQNETKVPKSPFNMALLVEACKHGRLQIIKFLVEDCEIPIVEHCLIKAARNLHGDGELWDYLSVAVSGDYWIRKRASQITKKRYGCWIK